MSGIVGGPASIGCWPSLSQISGVLVGVAVLTHSPVSTPFFACGPLVAALVVIGSTEGRAGYRDLGARLLRWRVGWRWCGGGPGHAAGRLARPRPRTGDLGSAGPTAAGLVWSELALIFAIRLVNPLDGPLGEGPAGGLRAGTSCRTVRSRSCGGGVLGLFVAGWHLRVVESGMLGRSRCR